MEQVAQALADPHPLSMLNLAGGLAVALDPTIPSADPTDPAELPPAADFVNMLTEGGGSSPALWPGCSVI